MVGFKHDGHCNGQLFNLLTEAQEERFSCARFRRRTPQKWVMRLLGGTTQISKRRRGKEKH
jgi:hypothetical protein